MASTRLSHPQLCDILCTLDTFLLTLPMYVLVGLAVHMFTRFPSPNSNNNRNSYHFNRGDEDSEDANSIVLVSHQK